MKDAVNKVPDRCYVEFDARTIKNEHNSIIEKRIKSMLQKYDCKLDVGVNVEANINTDNEMIQEIEEIIEEYCY